MHVCIQNPLIFAVQGYASGLQRYGVLLILTDGQITDMSDTMAAIARAAQLPLR